MCLPVIQLSGLISKKLSKTYDMATMLIITNANEKKIQFIEPQAVKRGQSVIR